MRWSIVALLLGCQGETVSSPTADAAADTVTDAVVVGDALDGALPGDTPPDTSAVPDTPLSDAWPAGALTASPGCGTFPGPKMVRLEAASPFCIDTTEVSNTHYDAFLASAKPAAPDYCFTPEYGSSETAIAGPNKPRTNVRWCAAFQYCAWAGKRLCGKIGGGHSSASGYIRNTESQWSFACRQGAKDTDYPYGPAEDLTKCAVKGPLADVGSKKTCTGESAPFNAVFDLSGNAGEWTDACDRYEGVTGEDDRVCAVRGGWIDHVGPTGKPRQDCNEPQVSTVMHASDTLTFRCCLDL